MDFHQHNFFVLFVPDITFLFEEIKIFLLLKKLKKSVKTVEFAYGLK